MNESESIVCMDPKNCTREHAAGMGGTPIHPPEGAIICPAGLDCVNHLVGEDCPA